MGGKRPKKMPARDDTGVDELGEAADQLFLSMRRARGNPAATGGLSLAQLTFLEPLVAGEALTVGQLAAAANVSTPNATRMIQQLEAKGHVVRERSRTDERKVLVHLTDTGAKLLTRLRANRRATQASAYAAFTPDERVELACQLRRLAEIIDGTA
ncbi:DNA-binding transcriptional regulator, MarR family [Mycolicibacterium rutilum]|uniref:DNA-binding transcriptional regulator, MarR family n=1 Tax=Mycolicibacterium rutilum TaxID=370526 RepID=A0A1H6J0U0_MYCRU|nr:MarR family transcriptional regulator [Mycolicibacterium rutilum]SEH54164.1 DNA-binding transcriptional regulator, MarR family [Mycolicibacterium rutilum]